MKSIHFFEKCILEILSNILPFTDKIFGSISKERENKAWKGTSKHPWGVYIRRICVDMTKTGCMRKILCNLGKILFWNGYGWMWKYLFFHIYAFNIMVSQLKAITIKIWLYIVLISDMYLENNIWLLFTILSYYYLKFYIPYHY